MNHPRVLHLIGSLEPGGTERQLVEFLQRCTDPASHRVVVFYRSGPLADGLPCPTESIGPIRRRWGGVPSVARAALELRRSIKNAPADLVHAHLGSSQVLAALAVPRDIPVVASRRGRTPILEGRVGHAILGFANRRSSVVLCNSQELATRAALEPGSPRVRVIRNGVDLSTFRPTPLPSGPPTVVLVARLRPEKGHDLFLRAFRLVLDRLPFARAILVGDGPSFDEVHRLSAELDLDPAVSFVGEVADPAPFFARAHVVALASPHEGFPNALLEAMASGRSVVATAVGGVPELVTDRLHGRLTQYDVDPFADALAETLADREACARMGKAARERAQEFGWAEMVERTEEVYASVMAGEDSFHAIGVA